MRDYLEPYVAADAASYVDQRIERELPLGREWIDGWPHEPLEEPSRERERPAGGEGIRHPLTSWMIERYQPAGAIFVDPGAEAERDLALFEQHAVPVAVVRPAPTGRGDRWAPLDPTARLLGDAWRERWEDEARDPERRRREPTPFAFTLQRQLAEWLPGTAD